MAGFNPRDFLSLNDSVKQSQTAQAAAPPAAPGGGWRPQYAPQDAYSTTVMPETGAPGPNHSLAGNRNYASLGTANDLAKMYGGRVLQANMAQGPTRTNMAQYAIDFGTGDPLNAGLLATRYDASDPTRDKFWESEYNRDSALQSELNYGSRYVPNAAPRHASSFEGPSNNPNYQWHAPQGGANFLNGGKSLIASAKLTPGGPGFGMPGAQQQAAAPAQSGPRPASLYGRPAQARSMSASPYGNRPPAQRPAAAQPITSAYRPVGMGRTF